MVQFVFPAYTPASPILFIFIFYAFISYAGCLLKSLTVDAPEDAPDGAPELLAVNPSNSSNSSDSSDSSNTLADSGLDG